MTGQRPPDPDSTPALCVCLLYAKPELDENGVEYYTLLRNDGSVITQIPKDEYDTTHLPLHDNSRSIATNDLDMMISSICFKKIDPRTVLGEMVLRTGFKIYDTTSCLDETINDRTPGVAKCKERLYDKLWAHLGFISMWAIHGLKPRIGDSPHIIDITYLGAMNAT